METMEYNQWHLWNVRIDEPIVTITDLLVSVVCFLAASFLFKIKPKSKVLKSFRLYFLLMGFATLFGGIFGHAIYYILGPAWKLPGWLISMLSIVFIERAAIFHSAKIFKPKWIKILSWINIIEFIIFLFLTLYTLNFSFVEYHAAYGMLVVVLSLEGYLFFKTRNLSSKIILWGNGFVALAGLVFMNEWSIHTWFNHLSLSHTLMAVAALLFYKAVKVMANDEGIE